MTASLRLGFSLGQDDATTNDDRLSIVTADVVDAGLNRYLFHLADYPEFDPPPAVLLEAGRNYTVTADFNFSGQWPEQFGETQQFPFTTTSGSLVVLGGGRNFIQTNREQPPLVVEIDLEAAPIPRWNVDSNGDWSAAGNWSGGVPGGDSATAIFGGVVSQPRTISLTDPIPRPSHSWR